MVIFSGGQHRDALLQALTHDLTSQGLEVVITATPEAPSDVRAQVHAAAEAALDFMTADPRRAQVLLVSHTDEVLQQARLASTRAVANAMAAMNRELLGDAAPSQLDTDLLLLAASDVSTALPSPNRRTR